MTKDPAVFGGINNIIDGLANTYTAAITGAMR
jgi:hypothetical protein